MNNEIERPSASETNLRCSSCKQPCYEKDVDMGIGPYEYWGQDHVHHDWQIVSNCCHQTIIEVEND